MKDENRKKGAVFFITLLILTTIPYSTFAKAKNIKTLILNEIYEDEKLIDIVKEDRNVNKNIKSKKHYIKIVNGTASKKLARKGERVEIFANQLQDKEFVCWTCKNNIKMQNKENQLTYFIMIDKNVKIVANYKEFDSGTLDQEESEENIEEDNNDSLDIEEVEEDNKTVNRFNNKRKKNKNKLK